MTEFYGGTGLGKAVRGKSEWRKGDRARRGKARSDKAKK
jgi:hypothetical protein